MIFTCVWPAICLRSLSNILVLRLDKRWTQKKLAGLSNVCAARLRDIEHSCANVRISTLLRIAAAFDLSLLQLVHLTTPEDELMELVQAARIRAGMR